MKITFLIIVFRMKRDNTWDLGYGKKHPKITLYGPL